MIKYWCNSYKQKFFGLLNNFFKIQSSPEIKTFENHWIREADWLEGHPMVQVRVNESLNEKPKKRPYEGSEGEWHEAVYAGF